MEVEVEAGPVEEEGAEADVASDRVLDSTSETFGIRSIESNPTPTPTPTPTPNPYPNPNPTPTPNQVLDSLKQFAPLPTDIAPFQARDMYHIVRHV